MNEKLGRAAFVSCAAELAQGQAQLSPPEVISAEQLRRERKSVRSIASNRYEQQQ